MEPGHRLISTIDAFSMCTDRNQDVLQDTMGCKTELDLGSSRPSARGQDIVSLSV